MEKRFTKRLSRVATFALALLMMFGAFVVPTPTVQASTDTLVANMDKYGFYADAKERTVALNGSVGTYSNASDAMNQRNKRSTYGAGKYFIYKSVDGSINISSRKGTAGAWINLNELKRASAEKITLYSPVKVYTNADNASAKRSSVKTYAAGTYYVYKSASNSKNITTAPGKAGGWTNLGELADAVTQRKPDFTLSYATKIYTTADDAMKGTNSKGTYAAGEYFIYKTYRNAINISRTYGKAGAWIASDMVTLQSQVNVYANADNAVRKVNSTAIYNKGMYYIYKETSTAVNITTTKGKAGGWISRTELDKATKGETTIVEKIDPNKPAVDIVNDFRIVLDAGHGPNANRGGVLFDEGRQNFLFMEKIIAELKKYPGVEILLTRDSMNQDPSLVARATEHKGADVFLSIHTNAAAASVRGVEIYGSKDNSKDAMAREITSRFASIMGTNDRGLRFRDYNTGNIYRSKDYVYKDYYGVMRGNDASEKLLIESIFHTNLVDSRAYLDNQENLARALVEVFAKYYGLRK